MLKTKKYILLVFLAMIAGCGASMPKATIDIQVLNFKIF